MCVNIHVTIVFYTHSSLHYMSTKKFIIVNIPFKKRTDQGGTARHSAPATNDRSKRLLRHDIKNAIRFCNFHFLFTEQ